jgi:hypothetical protein
MFRLSRGGIRAIAITGAALIVSALNIFVFPGLDSSTSDLLKLVALLLQVLGLSALIALIDWAILRLWISKFQGEWFYTSDAISIDPSGHVGYVKFFIRGGEIRYTVQLYTWASAYELAKGNLAATASVKGSAKSEVVLFDGEDSVKILYNFTPVEGDGGLGVLDLTGAQNGHAMMGAWVTARRKGKGPGDGVQQWFRKAEFMQYVDREYPNGLPAPKVKK